MLSTLKIEKAFKAIVEEAEKGLNKTEDKKVVKKLKNIITIAKHQSDVRDASKGSCCSRHKAKCK